MPAPTSLIGRLAATAEQCPRRDAVVAPQFCLSYEILAQLVEQQAVLLQRDGISGESVVGIRCADDVKHLILTLALIHTGATATTVPSYEALGASDRFSFLTHIVDEADAIDPLTIGKHWQHRKSSPAAEFAQLLFSTSGTTGTAKLVTHRDSDLVAQAHRHIGSDSERFACLGSVEENFVKRHRLYCIAVGATNVFPSGASDVVVEQCLQLDTGVLHVSAFQAQELLAAPGIERLRNIRLKLGGSLVPIALRRQLREQITETLQCGYGTTETGAISFTDPADRAAGESVGRPLPGIEVKVLSTGRDPVNTEERGELAIRCAGMFRGYRERSDLTSARLCDGWFRTGDIGYLDKDGRIYLCGRSDDMFVFNSMNVYPQDIESAICQHPDIEDAVVLPKPSSIHGNIPVALVVFRSNAAVDIKAVRNFVRERTGVRCPRQFVAVDSVRRNKTGKIARQETKALYAGDREIRRSLVELLNTGNRQRIRPALADAFVRSERDLLLRDLDLDSLTRMNLMILLEVEHDTVVTPDVFRRVRTLGELAARASFRTDGDASSIRQGQETEASPDALCEGTDSAYLLRFFRRVLHHCPTVAQLYKAMATLDHRLTPTDIRYLREKHLSGQLVPGNTAGKFVEALDQWFGQLSNLMANSGKTEPEEFTAIRKAPAVILFTGTGAAAEKTLLICFAGAGSRQMLMPSAVWLQHIDASQYDVLVIAEPLMQGYRHGVPMLGKNVSEVVRWLGKLDIVAEYKELRTIGCSAGGHAAVIAAFCLQARLGVSAGGRFHSERYPLRILGRVFAMRQAIKNGRGTRIIASFSADKTRDRNFARVLGWMVNTHQVAVRFADGAIGHLLLQRLVERGELGTFLSRTLFADVDAVNECSGDQTLEYPSASSSTQD